MANTSAHKLLANGLVVVVVDVDPIDVVGIGNGAAARARLLLLLNASLFTKLFSNDMVLAVLAAADDDNDADD